MSQELLEHIEGGIATLTMNRPEARNAMTRDMLVDLERSLSRLAADRSVRLVVLTGTGDAFCAGGDVKGFAKSATDGVDAVSFEERTHGLRMIMESSRWLHEMPKPTLAVIPGPAAGAGLSLALACDMRIASSNAKFTTAFSKIGLSGDFGGSYFLNYLVGAAKAREMYFTAQVVQSEEALRIGLVNRVVAREQLAEALTAVMSNEWLDDCTMSGPAEVVRERIAAWWATGVMPVAVMSAVDGGQAKGVANLFAAYS